MTKAIDCLVNVGFADQKQPEWMVRVKEDYFKAGDSFFKSPELPELLEDMDANGVEKAILIQGTATEERALRSPDRDRAVQVAVGGFNLLRPRRSCVRWSPSPVTTQWRVPRSVPASGATACTRRPTPPTTRSTSSAASSTCPCA